MPGSQAPPDPKSLAALHAEHVAGLEAGYAAALARAGVDGVVIHSGTPKRKSLFDDQDHPLRPTPHFQHWLPLATARSALLIRPGARPLLLWNNALDFWEAPPVPELDHFWGAFEVREGVGPDRTAGELGSPGRLAFVGEDLRDAAAWGIAPEFHNPPGLLADLDRLRTTKSRYEQVCIAEANRRAAQGHAVVLEAFRAGDHSELELHLLYLRATGQDDPETPYKNIVALGAHAATLHHVSYGRDRTGAQSLLLDAGARFLGYDSDITRTAVKGRGEAAAVFAELVHRMDALQRAVCREVHPGRPFEELHDLSHRLLAPVLRELGLVQGSDEELVDLGITRRFLPHGLGHSLGLQTHDVGCAQVRPRPENPFLRNTSTVAPGQVFTIEPGCYFIAPLLEELRLEPAGTRVDWRLVDQLRAFGGVRVEDDLVVEAAGVRNLTRAHLA
jgi:Xaa-Pro dipeptidase